MLLQNKEQTKCSKFTLKADLPNTCTHCSTPLAKNPSNVFDFLKKCKKNVVVH